MKQKGLRKLVSMILAVVMCLGLTCTGFAADESYSITITSAANGETYSAYKVFDLTYSGSGNDMIVSYTIDSSSNFYSVVSKATNIFTLTQVNGTSTYVVELATITKTDDGNDITRTATAEEILAVLSQADLTGKTADGSANASNNTAEIKLNEAGYYYVTTSLGSVVMLDSTTPDVKITDKNGEPTVDKEVKEGDDYGATSDAEVGSTVTFQTTISDIAGATNLVLHDIMTNLTFESISSVIYYSSSNDTDGETLSDSGEAPDYVVNNNPNDDCTFEIDFTDSFETKTLGTLKSTEEDTCEAYIIVTYTAKLTAGAITANKGGENETNVSYGEESNSSSTSDKTNTYTYSINVYKYTGSLAEGENTALPGAKFVLSKTELEDDVETTYYAVITDGVLTGWTIHREAVEGDDEGTVYATVLESDSNGKIDIKGLDADTYYLTEIVAPSGYNLLTSPITITITGKTDETEGGDGELTGEYTVSVGEGENKKEQDDITINVENNAGSQLPSTGGIGTTIFYIVGGILVLGAAVLFVTRKRLGSEN